MGKLLAFIAVVLVAAVGWMYFTDTDIEGGEMPDVEISGPEVRSTGTKEVTMTVPTFEVDAPEDDADGQEDEIIDDEGVEDPDGR